jgi:hypothetical protein
MMYDMGVNIILPGLMVYPPSCIGFIYLYGGVLLAFGREFLFYFMAL